MIGLALKFLNIFPFKRVKGFLAILVFNSTIKFFQFFTVFRVLDFGRENSQSLQFLGLVSYKRLKKEFQLFGILGGGVARHFKFDSIHVHIGRGRTLSPFIMSIKNINHKSAPCRSCCTFFIYFLAHFSFSFWDDIFIFHLVSWI